MKVFMLNTFCGVKSTGRIATDIAQLLESQGDQCLIGFGAEDAPPEYARFALRVGGPAGRKLHGAVRKLLDAEGYGSRLATRKLISQIKAFQPDVVHLHNLHGCYLNLPILFRYFRQSGVPLVWTLHDCWSFTGHCAYFDYARCDRWQTECHHCPQLKTYPICYGPDGSRRNYRLKKKLFTSLPSLTLTPPCHWLADTLRRSFLSQYPVRVIENGVGLSVFHPTESDLRKRYQLGAPYIVLAVAAEWTERKGLRYLLACARRLPCDYQLVVLGLTDAQIAQLPQGVLGLPKTASAHELAAWYTLASVVANPTMEDNMPLVNLEALACGTPVAVFRTGGCPEAVDDTCGRVVEQGDADGLREAVMALAPRKKELEQQCLARAKRFDSRDCYQKYCALYREVSR